MPKGRYNGQIPIIPVSKVKPVKISKTIANLPVITFVK
jgi:hypothetical protein